MAELVAVIGSPHYPWYHASTTAAPDRRSQQGSDFLERAGMLQDVLAEARPDALVVIGSDHFHQLFAGNMPALLVGRMDAYEGTFANEVREFGLPRVQVPGHGRLSTQLIEGLFSGGFDPAFSAELRLDHAVIVPLLIVNPPSTSRWCRCSPTAVPRRCHRPSASSSSGRCSTPRSPGATPSSGSPS